MTPASVEKSGIFLREVFKAVFIYNVIIRKLKTFWELLYRANKHEWKLRKTRNDAGNEPQANKVFLCFSISHELSKVFMRLKKSVINKLKARFPFNKGLKIATKWKTPNLNYSRKLAKKAMSRGEREDSFSRKTSLS